MFLANAMTNVSYGGRAQTGAGRGSTGHDGGMRVSRRRSRCGVGSVAAIAALIVMMLVVVRGGSSAMGIATSPGRPEGLEARGAGSGFPLWGLLPTSNFAVLGRGSLHGKQWGVFVFRDPGAPAGRRICVQEVEAKPYGGVFSVSTSNPLCGAVNSANQRPLISEGSEGSGGTVLAVLDDLDVDKLKLDTIPTKTSALKMSISTKAQANKAQVPRFSYSVSILAESNCLASLSGFDAEGNRVFLERRSRCVQP